MHDIKSFMPYLFDTPGTLLYIGARKDAHSWLDELIAMGHKISILEIWEPNVKGLLEEYKNIDITLGSVIDLPTLYDKNFDYVFWWHGPEHLADNDIYKSLTQIEKQTNKLIAIACPYGMYQQGSHEGNISETHLTYIYPDFFLNMDGYNVKTDGSSDKIGSEIVAWKKMDNNRS